MTIPSPGLTYEQGRRAIEEATHRRDRQALTVVTIGLIIGISALVYVGVSVRIGAPLGARWLAFGVPVGFFTTVVAFFYRDAIQSDAQIALRALAHRHPLAHASHVAEQERQSAERRRSWDDETLARVLRR